MNPEHAVSSLETLSRNVSIPSFADQLSQNKLGQSPLPYEIRSDLNLFEQCKERQGSSKIISEIYSLIPDATMPLSEAVERGIISKETVANMYTKMSDLLTKKENQRLVLYLPFEFLPSPQDESVEAKSFSHSYKSAWGKLLHQKNIRADFYEGDVPEQELRSGEPLPLVAKAAHLIPFMIEKGAITLDEVLDILEHEEDTVTISSIADALRAVGNMTNFDERELHKLESCRHPIIQNMAPIIMSDRKKSSTPERQVLPTLENIIQSLVTETEAASSEVEQEALPEGRASWLLKSRKEKAIEATSTSVALLLDNQTLNLKDMQAVLGLEKDPLVTSLLGNGIRQYILQQSRADKIKAAAEYERYKPILFQLTEDELRASLLRLYSVDVISKEELSVHGMKPPTLGTIDNEPSLEDKDIVEKCISEIEKNEELSLMIYPVAISLGSHMKGYATKNSDRDMGVFVRPGTSFENRERIQELLQEILSRTEVRGSFMEFWLTEHEGGLWIQDFVNPDSSLGDSSLSHPLLGSWFGNEQAIRELYGKLMPQYLYSKGKTILEEDARMVWLEDMEHTILQYRLMHKGYTSLFAAQGNFRANHMDEIDGESTFYDPGYRRLATKLFIDKVFIPQLDKTSQ